MEKAIFWLIVFNAVMWIIIIFMQLYRVKLKSEIKRLNKEMEYYRSKLRTIHPTNSYQVNNNVDELIKRPQRTTVAQRKALHRANEMYPASHATRPGDDSSILNPVNIAVATMLLSNHDAPASAPDCSPSSDSNSDTSFDSGSGSCDTGGFDGGSN